MAAEEGTPADLSEARLDGVTEFRLEKEVARVGTRYLVVNPSGGELFQVERPRGQAAASEILGLLGDNSRSSRRHGTGGTRTHAKIEHSMARHYEMWTLEDKWLGRIEKARRNTRPAWTLYLSDWQPAAWVDVGWGGYGIQSATLIDVAGEPALAVNVGPAYGPIPIVGRAGQVVGDLQQVSQGMRQGLSVRVFAKVHPIHFVFLAVAFDYEVHPDE